MQENAQLTDLPQGIFGDVSFEEIFIKWAWNLETIHPDAILQSKDRLRRLQINSYYENLDNFPWSSLSEMVIIDALDLMFNALTTISAFESPTLELLTLDDNRISTVEAGWQTPNLRYLLMGESYTY